MSYRSVIKDQIFHTFSDGILLLLKCYETGACSVRKHPDVLHLHLGMSVCPDVRMATHLYGCTAANPPVRTFGPLDIQTPTHLYVHMSEDPQTYVEKYKEFQHMNTHLMDKRTYGCVGVRISRGPDVRTGGFADVQPYR